MSLVAIKYALDKYAKKHVKNFLLHVAPLFCRPLTRDATRRLNFLEPIFKSPSFELETKLINNKSGNPSARIFYPDSILFKIGPPRTKNTFILPSGGICTGNEIICTGFPNKKDQANNVLGYLQRTLKKKRRVSGSIICNWPQQFLTYGDFVLQLLPELCLIKSVSVCFADSRRFKGFMSSINILSEISRTITISKPSSVRFTCASALCGRAKATIKNSNDKIISA